MKNYGIIIAILYFYILFCSGFFSGNDVQADIAEVEPAKEIVVPEFIAENLDAICQDHYDYKMLNDPRPRGFYRNLYD